MEDGERKEELSKEVLAPPDAVREELVATAVKFLQNPKVAQSPISQKQAFLQRKGLTEEEIKIAVDQSGVKETTTVPAPLVHGSEVSTLAQHQPPPQPPQLPPRQSEITVSRWMKAREILSVVTMMTGITYAAHHLYMEFLQPWLFGTPTAGKRLDNLEEMLKKSVQDTSTSLGTIDEKLGQQQEKMQSLSHDVNSRAGGDGVNSLQHNQGINEIKTELTTIKGLLLNRRQFPPVPQSTPVLPSWQLASSAADANSNQRGSDTSTGPSPTPVTFSSSPAPKEPDEVTNSGDANSNRRGSDTSTGPSPTPVSFSSSPAPKGPDEETMAKDNDAKKLKVSDQDVSVSDDEDVKVDNDLECSHQGEEGQGSGTTVSGTTLSSEDEEDGND